MVQPGPSTPITQSADDPPAPANPTVHHNSLQGRIVIGAFLGLTWGASLRAWMVLLALELGDPPQFTWQGTFAAILLPAALLGANLGAAAYKAEASGGNRWRWAILSPLLLVLGPVIFTDDFISTFVTTGMGGGAIGVALVGMLGGYALSGFGPRWTRWASGIITIVLTIVLFITSYPVDLTAVAAASVSEVFGALLFVLLMALLVGGVSAPSRCWRGPRI